MTRLTSPSSQTKQPTPDATSVECLNQSYRDFLSRKQFASCDEGIELSEDAINPLLYPFQRALCMWALRKGRVAVFSDCGTGKTPVQLEWARHVCEHTGKDVLILAPLAVTAQTKREGEKFGIAVNVCRTSADLKPGINIANYERLHHFKPEPFGGIVLDESSILKAFDGKTRKAITEFADSIPFRLACTATPAPNDLLELTNHSEFLGVMRGKEIIALFFTQDGNSSHAWRLKGHAKQAFWKWLASWSTAMRKPSDLGFDDAGFILPALRFHQVTTEVTSAPVETLFHIEAQTMQERLRARRESISDRVQACADLVNASGEQWLLWCNLNKEGDALEKAIPGSVQVAGSDTPEFKEKAIIDFIEGRTRVIISKSSIFGWGLNLQNCANVAFVGLSDSFEALYQAVRRCWRFGQTREVNCHLITAETEGAVTKNIARKEKQAAEMMENIVRYNTVGTAGSRKRDEMEYREEHAKGRSWDLYLGDSIVGIDRLEDNSVGICIHSPPFPGMYAYTNSVHDAGNTRNIDEMIEHYRFLAGKDKLQRVMMPGRLVCIHLTQMTAQANREGWIGIIDFRGRVIQMMTEEGWNFASETTIDKNPQVKAARNKERGLLFKSLANDSSVMRMALADYILCFRKPGMNPKPIRAGMTARYNGGNGWITEDEWIEWAAPVWYRQTPGYPRGIRETDVLNVAQARETDDERHLCPLQLGVIERLVKLWSAPGDLVLDPFNGIGSTGYEAVRLGRRYVGFELKRSYWETAYRNLRRAEAESEQRTLFDGLDAEEPAAAVA